MKWMNALMYTTALAFFFATGDAQAKYEASALTKSVSISFSPGASKLSESDKDELCALVRDGLKAGSIDYVTVAAWSDRAMPPQGKKLSDTDRGLAKERLQAISRFLKMEMEVADVDTYNMAENANWLARTFNTRDAELKSVFGRTDAEAPAKRAEFGAIRREGGPSLAVVVLKQAGE